MNITLSIHKPWQVSQANYLQSHTRPNNEDANMDEEAEANAVVNNNHL